MVHVVKALGKCLVAVSMLLMVVLHRAKSQSKKAGGWAKYLYVESGILYMYYSQLIDVELNKLVVDHKGQQLVAQRLQTL